MKKNFYLYRHFDVLIVLGYKDFVWSHLPYKSSFFRYSLKQIHSSRVVDYFSKGGVFEGDGLYTFRKNVVLFVKVADCYPVFIWNDFFISVLHVGWRGLRKGILTRFLNKFSNSGKLKAFVGYGICGKCYEVDCTFFKNFKNIRKIDGKCFFDLRKEIKDILNLKKVEIVGEMNLCTFENTFLYSRRRGDFSKRLYAGIMRI